MQAPIARNEWLAKLSLQVADRNDRTHVTHLKHEGPLRVQKPFVQENGACHIYLLHPPGGMVGGDELLVEVESLESSRALLTTPSAGKFYRCAPHSRQKQSIAVRVNANAALEWLPQENIFFNEVDACLSLTVHLSASCTFVGWDIQCLGRTASGERFERGEVRQHQKVYVDGRLIHCERSHLLGSTRMMAAPWGYADRTTIGTLFAYVSAEKLQDYEIVERLSSRLCEDHWGVTTKPGSVDHGLLLVRYLGESPESCRRELNWVRQLLAEHNLCPEMGHPRIWNT